MTTPAATTTSTFSSTRFAEAQHYHYPSARYLANGRGRTFRVASFDGGGVRGIIPAKIMEAFCEKVGAQPHEFFDMGIGTSTGGLLCTAYLGKKNNKPVFSAKDLPGFWNESAPEIFNKKHFWSDNKVVDLFRSKYSADGLVSVIDKIADDTMNLKNSVFCPLVITSTDVTGFEEAGEIEPFFFRTIDVGHNHLDESIYQIANVLRCTSAAPTYFPPAEVVSNGKEYAFLDGGICNNNPAHVGYIEAKLRHAPVNTNIELISFGTGDSKLTYSYESLENGGQITYASKLLNLFFNSMDNNPDVLLRGTQGYYRFQVHNIPKELSAIDDVTAIPHLEKLADEWIAENEEYLDSVARTINPRDPTELYALPYEVY